MISMVFNRVLKNKYQAVSQGDYRLEAQRLERRITALDAVFQHPVKPRITWYDSDRRKP